MSETVKVRKIGDSYAIVLSKALLQELDVGEGDTLYIVRTPNGIHLTSSDPDLTDALNASREYMDEHEDAFRKLAE